ncbi:MAG: hypothetical protein HYU64_18325 [Armatimonadetes bacterium]|nr:hypothetical protein [Armatimonadota bacterium]
MKEKFTKKEPKKRKSRTDVTRLERMEDGDIDFSDIPETSEDFWDDGDVCTLSHGGVPIEPRAEFVPRRYPPKRIQTFHFLCNDLKSGRLIPMKGDEPCTMSSHLFATMQTTVEEKSQPSG